MIRPGAGAALAVMIASAAAAAEPARAPQNAVSLQLASLSARSLAVEYERALWLPRLSLAGGVGARDTADGDYQGTALGAGIEARYWLSGRALWTRLREARVGAYLGARLDVAYSTLTDTVRSERIGTSWSIAESVSFGYRLAFWDRLELTPSAGLAVRTEFDGPGRLPPWTRGSLSFGLALGYLF